MNVGRCCKFDVRAAAVVNSATLEILANIGQDIGRYICVTLDIQRINMQKF